nr:MAG TPA: hypothetical protein [Caudoviricetes sp.]
MRQGQINRLTGVHLLWNFSKLIGVNVVIEGFVVQRFKNLDRAFSVITQCVVAFPRFFNQFQDRSAQAGRNI